MSPPGLPNRALEAARQYQSEHDTPITPGQLAVRLKAASEQAAQALAVLDLDPHSPSQKIPTVNGLWVSGMLTRVSWSPTSLRSAASRRYGPRIWGLNWANTGWPGDKAGH